MKGFIITMFILITVSAVVFFLGWIQIQIDDSEIGVIFTKTHGWEAEPVYPGQFVWRWQGIFPTVLRRYDFTLEERSISVQLSASLPGSDLYADYVPDNPDFSWELGSRLAFTIRGEDLPYLAEHDGLRPRTQGGYLDILEDRIRASISSALPEIIAQLAGSSELAAGPMALPLPAIQNQLQEHLSGEYPRIEFVFLYVENAVFPDLELYAIARQRYLDVLSTETAARERALGSLARIELINTVQRESLMVLGQILEENPMLLDYLRIISETGSDPIGLSPLFANLMGNADVLDSIPLPAPAGGDL